VVLFVPVSRLPYFGSPAVASKLIETRPTDSIPQFGILVQG
jgi:hypothetical protein